MDFGSGPGPTGPQKLVCISAPKYERLYQKMGQTQSSHLTQCPSELLGQVEFRNTKIHMECERR